MKYFLLICLSYFGFSAQIFAQADAHFPEKFKQFDHISDGEILDFEFEFENTGDEDLFIIEVDVTCGCTVPDWPKEAIKPGVKSSIKVRFDSEGRQGINSKGINITTNVGEVNLIFYVNVIPSLPTVEADDSE
jgi:hypothetical protein